MEDRKITRGHSCVPCQHRKIRCNGQTPCAYCSRTGKDCIRQRSRTSPLSSSSLKSFPAALDLSSSKPEGSSTHGGQVIVSGDQRRYVEQNKLWSSIGDELQNDDSDPTSSIYRPGLARARPLLPEISLMFGHQELDATTHVIPSAIQAFQLWQVFLSNVHPLTKLLHGPSVQETILKAVSEPRSTPPSTEALTFSIYLVAVVSLSDDACRNLLSLDKDTLLLRYCYATQEALNRVDFLRSTSFEVLQAFTLYLLSLRYLCDHHILWLLTGLATRMGQRMGLHRESSFKGLSPFETEMRRRLWWQVTILDTRTAQLTGASMSPDIHFFGDTKQPLNVNDSDLVPSMASLPHPPIGTTDMIFCSIRYDIGVWMLRNRFLVGLSLPDDSSVRFLKAVDELERQLESRYLAALDTAVPLHLLTSYFARSAVCQMRISVYHPIHRPERDSGLSRELMDMLFENSLRAVQYDILSHSTSCLQRFVWHVSNYFPFETFVLLLSTLSGRPTGPMVDMAWDVINQVYEHHPCFITDSDDPLYKALGSLALRTWRQRLAAAASMGLEMPAEPPFLSRLLKERTALVVTPQLKDSISSTADSTSFEAPRIQSQMAQAPVGDSVHQPDTLQWPTGWEDTAKLSDQSAPLAEGMQMDWDYWQVLLDNNSFGVGTDPQQPLDLPSFFTPG